MAEPIRSGRMAVFANSIAEKNKADKTGKSGVRDDLCFVDYVIRADAAGKKTPVVDMLIEYAKFHGTPKPSEVFAFVRRKLDDKVIVAAETLLDYPGKDCMSVVGIMRPIVTSSDVRPVTHVTRLAAVDKEGVVWDVSEGEGGKSILKRIDAENIEDLLKKRVALQRTRSFVTIRQASGDLQIDVGDRISFMSKLNKPTRGTVTSMEGGSVNVKIEGAGTTKVDKGQVLAIIEKGEKGLQKDKDVIKQYYNSLLPGYGTLMTAKAKK